MEDSVCLVWVRDKRDTWDASHFKHFFQEKTLIRNPPYHHHPCVSRILKLHLLIPSWLFRVQDLLEVWHLCLFHLSGLSLHSDCHLGQSSQSVRYKHTRLSTLCVCVFVYYSHVWLKDMAFVEFSETLLQLPLVMDDLWAVVDVALYPFQLDIFLFELWKQRH